MFKRSSILRATVSIQSSFVADTYRVGVVVTAVCPDLFERTATVDLSVACNVEMIADVAESPVEDVSSRQASAERDFPSGVALQ